jgi:hypothetical protein
VPEDTFHGSRDFLLAWDLLDAHRRTQPVRKNKAGTPLRARATCASLALELALKSHIAIAMEGKTPGRTHSFVALFRVLASDVQRRIASSVLLNGRPTDVDGLIDALTQCEGTFETWRHLHEHENADFHEPYIVDVTRALHASILALHPEWRNWPGVIL